MDLRLDRLATLYVARPLQRLTSASQHSIPILMYHSISDEDESGLHPYYRTATSPAVFEQQMEWLHLEGFRSVGLTEAAHRITQPSIPENWVVITFDDGYRNFYTDAFPVLNRFGFTATMFLPTAYIGETPQIFNKKPCMTWSEVRELQRCGIEFGSHTVTHPQLHEIELGKVREEVEKSKHVIEDKLASKVDSFAYPYAFPDTDAAFRKQLRDILQQAGYANGVCTTIGRPRRGSDSYFLKRLPVNSCDDAQLFQAKLDGSYDWLAKPQYLVKKAKSWA